MLELDELLAVDLCLHLLLLRLFVKVGENLVEAFEADRVLDLQPLLFEVALHYVPDVQIPIDAVPNFTEHVQLLVDDLPRLGKSRAHLSVLYVDYVVEMLGVFKFIVFALY